MGTLNREDQVILDLIRMSMRVASKGNAESDAQAGSAAAFLKGMAGDALQEIPISHFGRRMKEAISLLASGKSPASGCKILSERWSEA